MLRNIKNYLVIVVVSLGIAGRCSLVQAVPNKNDIIRELDNFYTGHFKNNNIYIRQISAQDSTLLRNILNKVITFVGTDNPTRAANTKGVVNIYKETVERLQKILLDSKKNLEKQEMKLKGKNLTVLQFYVSIAVVDNGAKSDYVTVADYLEKNYRWLQFIKNSLNSLHNLNNTYLPEAAEKDCRLVPCKNKFAVLQKLTTDVISLLTTLQEQVEALEKDYVDLITRRY